MRKQTKIAAVVSAAALLALGASITSFAGSKGTWMLVDGEWYCYDKNGDVYENTFCNSNGKEYYVGEDGMLVRSDWVEYDGSYYFVNSSGAKITNDWRLTTPYDDENAEEEWYYFQSTGKRAENKKIVYKGQTFFFDADGKMLTGWVTADGTQVVNEENNIGGDTYYCDETGARVAKEWIYTTEPTAEDDEADADEFYYYLKSNGHPVISKKYNNIKGQSYIFDEEGKMLSGWVANVIGVASDSDVVYEEIDGEEDTEVALSNYEEVYYCGADDDGHVKKNKWIKTWKPSQTYEEDEDNSKKWYWIEKDGKIYIPVTPDAAGAQKLKFEEGKLLDDGSANVTKKKVNSKDYFFNQDGEMVSGFVMTKDIASASDALSANALYYFGGGDDGSMKTGSQSIKDDCGDVYKFYFGTRTVTKDLEVKGAGITGNKSNKLYYHGMLVKAGDYKYQVATVDINGVDYSYIVNQNGSIQHANSEYKEDGDILIDAKTVKDDKGNVTYAIDFKDSAEDMKNESSAVKYSVINIDALKNYVDEIDGQNFVFNN